MPAKSGRRPWRFVEGWREARARRMNHPALDDALKHYFGFDGFRPLQR